MSERLVGICCLLALSSCLTGPSQPAAPADSVQPLEGPAADLLMVGESQAEVAHLPHGEVSSEPSIATPPRASEPPITAESVMALVRSLPIDRAPGRPGHRQAREWVVARLRDLGLSPEVQPFRWAAEPGVQLANIEWVLPGDSDDAPLIVVCAHHDTVPGSGGADDNGSGVAVLLELARRSAGRSLPAEVRLVWFDGEEVGLVGSRAWLEQLSDSERGRLLGAINLETVGYVDRRPHSQVMPPGSEVLLDPGDVGDFLLVIANQDSAELASVVAMGLASEAGSALRVEVFDRLPGAGWVMPDSRRSDHASFWDAAVPALLLTDTANFRNPHYHRASDLPDSLDGEFLAAVARGVERALLILASDG